MKLKYLEFVLNEMFISYENIYFFTFKILVHCPFSVNALIFAKENPFMSI